MRRQTFHSADIVIVAATLVVATGFLVSSGTPSSEPLGTGRVEAADKPAEEAESESTEKIGKTSHKDIEKQLFVGQVVFAQEALKKRGIKVAEEMKSQAVLETPKGEMIPIAADWRGRALYQDKRLRNRPIELVGYRRPGIPYLQVLVIYLQDEKGRRQEMDYWCEICSIPMYEIKPCECCQADIELRLRDGKFPSYLSESERKKALTPAGKSE